MPISSAQHSGIHYRRFEEPLSLTNLHELNRAAATDPVPRRILPLIEDLSGVNVSRLSAQGLRHYVMRTKNSPDLTDAMTNKLVGCVAGDIGDIAKLRLFGIYADLAGVRNEENFLITTTLKSALSWILLRQGRDPEGSKDALDAFTSLAKARRAGQGGS